MTGSHEVTGSIPVSSTNTKIAFESHPEKTASNPLFPPLFMASPSTRKPFPGVK